MNRIPVPPRMDKRINDGMYDLLESKGIKYTRYKKRRPSRREGIRKIKEEKRINELGYNAKTHQG